MAWSWHAPRCYDWFQWFLAVHLCLPSLCNHWVMSRPKIGMPRIMLTFQLGYRSVEHTIIIYTFDISAIWTKYQLHHLVERINVTIFLIRSCEKIGIDYSKWIVNRLAIYNSQSCIPNSFADVHVIILHSFIYTLMFWWFILMQRSCCGFAYNMCSKLLL